MQNILLPTDLSLTSLYPVHEICKNATGHPCNIHIIHTLNMPTGIGDLLFLQQRKPFNKVPPQFTEGLDLLRKKYPAAINRLSFDFLWSNSRIYLNNYMESRSIQLIYMLSDYDYGQALPQSASCIKTLPKTRVPVIHIERDYPGEFGTLTTLLYKEKIHA
ncbi:MAG TPA: hypothetical protein VL727_24930 [Puia sp.]|jgi:hypothetical protein|nr:hypothetical protein [Puia sp.]